MKLTNLALAATAMALTVPAIALAKPGNQGGHGNHGQAQHGNHGQHAGHNQGGNQHGGQACPPGLAKKSPACVPPGQWKRGDRLPESWVSHYTRYRDLPELFRSRYADRTDRRYVYHSNRVFVIDAVSRAVVDILVR